MKRRRDGLVRCMACTVNGAEDDVHMVDCAALAAAMREVGLEVKSNYDSGLFYNYIVIRRRDIWAVWLARRVPKEALRASIRYGHRVGRAGRAIMRVAYRLGGQNALLDLVLSLDETEEQNACGSRSTT